LYVKAGELTKARTLFEQCTQLAPDFADGWAHLASVLLKVGRGNEADAVIAQGLKQCPNSPGLHLLQANRLQDTGQLEHAEAEFREVIRLRPEEAEPYIKLASLFFSTGRISDGRRELDRAIAAEPQNPVALTTLAFHAISTGDANAAMRWMNEVRNQPRIEPSQRNTLAEAFQQRFGRPPP
jgi:Flp pilus assembly protein TadD